MRFILFSLFALFSLISCENHSDCINSVDQSTVEMVLCDFISADSLKSFDQATIVDFNYQKPAYADGFLIPSPPGSSNISELDILFYVDDKNYFNYDQDTATIKEQLKNSHKRIPKLFRETDNYDPILGIYTFHVPIFNCNRSAAFVSYTYEKEGYWEYNGAILERYDSEWTIVKKIPIGMN